MRPTHFSEVKDKYTEVARFEIGDILVNPVMMRAYTGFIEAAEKQGGRINNEYGSIIRVLLPKSHAQLVDTLAREQREWDRMKERYDAAVADPASVTDDWHRTQISEWADDEEIADPFVPYEPQV